jgi:hypothetical protein
MPLVEEYFDGEVDGRTGELMSAHLSTCADCAAALDALRFEQEIYARYDRGIEVSPALWSAVRAEIAQEPLPDVAAKPLPLFVRLREQFADALGAFKMRPALASSLGLLVVGLAAGALWLTHVRRPEAPKIVAENVPVRSVPVNPSPAATVGGDSNPFVSAAPVPPPVTQTFENAAQQQQVSSREMSARVVSSKSTSVDELLAYRPASRSDNRGIVVIDEHDKPEIDPTNVEPVKTGAGVAMTTVSLQDSGDKELARHVEQAQMLLRSFKNARPAADDSTVNVAYEKSLSRKLLDENATLQLQAESAGDKDTKQVLDTIEPFLLDIANMRDNPSRDEVRSVKERMRKKEIIAALQVY